MPVKPSTSAGLDVTERPLVTAPAGGADPEPLNLDGVEVWDIRASADFVYLASPRSWDVFPVGDDGWEILPALREFRIEPGVAGVREVEVRGKTVADASAALAAQRKNGWIEVPKGWTVTAFGQEFRGYSHAYEGKKGKAHLPRWQRLYTLGGAVESERDETGFREFQRRVAAELLPPLDANVRRALKQKLVEMQRQVAGRDPTRGVAGAVAATIAGKLSVFEGGKQSRGRVAKPKGDGEGA